MCYKRLNGKSKMKWITSRLIKRGNDNIWRSTFLFKVLLIISGTAMTGLLSLRGSIPMIAINVFASFVLLCVLAFKCKFLEKVFTNVNKAHMIITAAFSLFAGYQFVIEYYGKFNKLIEKMSTIVPIPEVYQSILGKIAVSAIGAVALLAIFVFLYAFISRFWPVCSNWIIETDKTDKIYLIIAGALFAIAIIVIFSLTNVFYGANIDGEIINYNVVYTTDSANQISTNVYLNIDASENDIRQPLFGLFAIPFAICATIISKLLFFVPNVYPITINIIQIFLLLSSLVMIAKMLNVDNSVKKYVLIILTLTYPTLLFAFNMEQYIFSLFWLIMFLYASVNNWAYKDYYFIAATGSMLTSVIIFPLLFAEKRIIGWVKAIFSVTVKFLIIISIFGQLPEVINGVSLIQRLLKLGTKVALSDKLLQFFNFVTSCFVKTSAGINETAHSHISYQLEPVTTLNYCGVALLILAVIGFALNFRKRFAQICFGWVVFSFILLGIVGWGTVENGLILYTLYLGWAYWALVVLFVEKIFAKYKVLRCTIYSLTIISMIYINLPSIYELIAFGTKYYPAR